MNTRLKDKNIVLCITGGIAAYKAVSLASLLVKKGANVYPVLTKNATEFITPLTLKTITKNKVTTTMFDDSDFIPHISLSELADIIIVAPATANIIAKAASGIADDMVSTLLLSSNAKKLIVPAMNTKMYLNKITQKNIKILKDNDFYFLEPDEGVLACGAEGVGRFPELDKIYSFIMKHTDTDNFYNGKKVLITTGGTVEDIDPVRFISNRSSGKMGFSFAEEFIYRGADVTLIAGSVSDKILADFKNKFSNVEIVNVRSANEMKDAVTSRAEQFDIYIMVAAVADYTTKPSPEKIKKSGGDLSLKLDKTDDVLKSLKKRKDAIYIGFAAETENLLENAKGKLKSKELDFIIANEVKGNKSAIGSSKAEVFLLNKWDEIEFKVDFNDKEVIAQSILNKISEISKKYPGK